VLAIAQEPAVGLLSHWSSVSLQESAVQLNASTQLRAVPTQAPAALHASLTVQYRPSLHVEPVGSAVQLELLTAGLHVWHGFAGFAVPAE
jgi:hypothetical protein